jgi:hypothetical protein
MAIEEACETICVGIGQSRAKCMNRRLFWSNERISTQKLGFHESMQSILPQHLNVQNALR